MTRRLAPLRRLNPLFGVAALTSTLLAVAASGVRADNSTSIVDEPVSAQPAEAQPVDAQPISSQYAGPQPAGSQLQVATPILRGPGCGTDKRVPYKRGVAILSPVESPDRTNPKVGGKTIYTPYYPDYCAHRNRGPRLGIPGNGLGYVGPSACNVAPGAGFAIGEVGAVGSTGYGEYNGARQDEAALLHLGGNAGASADRSGKAPDLIDQIQGRSYGPAN